MAHEHTKFVEQQFFATLKRNLVMEKKRNVALQCELERVYIKKKAMKEQIIKLTWIARAAVGQDSLEAMLDEPVDFGYTKAPEYKKHTPSVFPRMTMKKIRSDSPAETTDYEDDEMPETTGWGAVIHESIQDPKPSTVICSDKIKEAEPPPIEEVNELDKSTLIEIRPGLIEATNYFKGLE
jgi:hypothetical protein